MNDLDSWLPRGSFRPRRYRPGGIGNWSGHLPFARDLVNAVQPQLLVELGAHYGESYFGFCQAIQEAGISCKCYAVDTWVGEQHATFYDESVFLEVKAYNDANYRAFSFLLRTTFDEARSQFSDNSIDILHIDGLHTYSAVKHDFDNWLPAVKPGGIVLLHDTCARHFDFGVWKVWDELGALGERFNFLHNWGLGVFRKPGGDSTNPFLSALLSASDHVKDHLQHFYSLSARNLEYDHVRSLEEKSAGPAEVLRIYPEGTNGYSAELEFKTFFKTKQWQHLSVDFTCAAGQRGVRIDPAEHSGVIDVSRILVRKAGDREIVFRAIGADELRTLAVGGDMVPLPNVKGAEFFRYLSKGTDPQIFIELDPSVTDQPLILDVWVRVDSEVTPLLATFSEVDARAQADFTAARQQQDLLRNELSIFEAKLAQIETSNAALLAELQASQAQASEAGANLHALASDYEALRSANQQLNQSRADLEAKLNAVLTSRSWRITSSLRRLLGR